ncbi:MAG: GFA family protein [Pseudohongiella sp.]|nr:GFA family protein [Pseudohongiella sp.]
MLTATCHCGAIEIEVAEKPNSITQCNCSICRRYGALWAYYTISSATVNLDPSAVRTYRWSDKVIDFVWCNTCGCLTHYEDSDKVGDYRVAINTRMMNPSDIEGIGIRFFDGASM